MSARQLSLLFDIKPAPSFDNFVTGRNMELVDKLKSVCSRVFDERFIYIWGNKGTGKSHLLSAMRNLSDESGMSTFFFRDNQKIKKHRSLCGSSLLLVDDVHLRTDSDQYFIFDWYNELKANHGALVVAGDKPPSALNIRADLLTRLGWGLVYRVHELTDSQKLEAMVKYSLERGFYLSSEVINYVLRHRARDLNCLLEILEGIDYYSIETRRRVTVPLVKEFFAISQSVKLE